MSVSEPSTSASTTTNNKNYILHPNIPYTVTNHHPRQVLDLYIPKQDTNSQHSTIGHPIILYVHGGAFKFGSKESDLLPLRQLNNGYAIAAINYRRSGEAIFPAMIEDCKSAIRFLRSSDCEKYVVSSENGVLDASRIVAWGESAGGHAVAMLGTTSTPEPRGRFDVGDHLDGGISSAVSGVVDYYGPTDFLQMDGHLPDDTGEDKEGGGGGRISKYRTHNDGDSPESLYLGQKITEIPERVREADPNTYIEEMVSKYRDGDRCPEFFIAHGTKDYVVPEYMSQLLVRNLEAHSLKPEYLAVAGTGHCFTGINETQQRELDEKIDAFLKRVFDI